MDNPRYDNNGIFIGHMDDPRYDNDGIFIGYIQYNYEGTGFYYDFDGEYLGNDESDGCDEDPNDEYDLYNSRRRRQAIERISEGLRFYELGPPKG